MPARSGRHKTYQSISFWIDDAEIDFGVTHQPITVSGLGDADGFASQGLAYKYGAATPLDLTAGSHAPHGVAGVVPRLSELLWVMAGRGLIDTGRRFLADRLVRAMVVVVIAESIEALLLFAWARCRRPGGLLLQGSVEALMTAVLLRLARLDPLEGDTRLEPAQRQP